MFAAHQWFITRCSNFSSTGDFGGDALLPRRCDCKDFLKARPSFLEKYRLSLARVARNWQKPAVLIFTFSFNHLNIFELLATLLSSQLPIGTMLIWSKNRISFPACVTA
jgi:hypothetical protein